MFEDGELDLDMFSFELECGFWSFFLFKKYEIFIDIYVRVGVD